MTQVQQITSIVAFARLNGYLNDVEALKSNPQEYSMSWNEIWKKKGCQMMTELIDWAGTTHLLPGSAGIMPE